MIETYRAVLAASALLALAPGTASAFQKGAVRSLLEARHQNVVIQEWDSSCGAAALATVLQFQLGDPVSERAVAVGMLRGLDPDRVRTRGGFSLLDMKRYAQSRGYEADGFAGLTSGQLMRLAPAIVPVRSHGGDHFVVFRGVVNGQAVLADPAFGNRSEPYPVFESKWKDRLAFAVRVPGKRGNRMHATKRDLLRVEDEESRTDEALPRPLSDAQLALAFAIDAPRALPPASPLVPIASPDNPAPRAPGLPSSPASPSPPTASAGTISVPFPVSAPGATSPVTVGTTLPSLSPGTVTIAAPLLPPVTIPVPVAAPAVTITVPTVPALPPLPLPRGR